MPFWFYIAAQVLVLAYALVAGVFLAFSDFIMRALARAPSGDAAMQSINREVFRWVFMALFLGLAPVSLGVAAHGAFWVGGAPGALIALAGLTYVFGCFGVTVVANVPMNTALSRHAAGTPEATRYWQEIYVPRWTFWNTLRACACALSALALLLGFSLQLGGA